ncbi:MAG TPA: iron ABC transporter substrate-binding protein [Jiangellales bacterium]|nr:iron ABC transporter substrate-binding protein [Jiangellales bacterium]
MRSRHLLSAATAAALALSLAACGDSDAAGDGTTEESSASLVVYSGRNEDLVQPIIDRFTEETGIEVAVRYAGTGELAAQLLEEGDRTEADAFFAQDGGALGAIAKEGLFAELPEETLDRVDERFRADDGRWVGVSGRARVVAYNPDEVPEEEVPRSVLELTDPRWSGEVGIAPTNASFEAFVTGLRVLEGDDAARAWLEGMAANDVEIFDNNNAVLDAVDNGVVSLGLINHYYWYERVAELGEDGITARLVFPGGGDPGALVNVAGVGVVATTDDEEEAQQFVDYLLSEDAQTYFAEETKEYPLVEGVETDAALPPLEELDPPAIDLSDLDTLAETQTMIQEAGLS